MKVRTKLLVLIFALSSLNFFAQKRLIIDTVCFNTKFDDYGIRKFGNDLIIVTAAKEDETGVRPTDEISKKPFSDILKLNGCSLEEIKIMGSENNVLTSINSSLNDGPISCNPSADFLFFTNNSYSKTNRLGIFYSQAENDSWSTPVPFPLNDDNHNVTHPFYDEVNKRLYYASDFEKGRNKYDIYYSDYNGADWSRPVAVAAINSDSVECFPFIYKDKIYFTSNNSKSLGGLDLFVFSDGVVTNLGEGINSIYDDLSILPISDTSGYFSSNRQDLGGQDDIYSFYYEPIVVIEAVVEEPVVEVATPIKVNELANVFFGFDQYSIKESENSKLQEVVRLMIEQTNLYIVVSGHTDNQGTSTYNLELSKKRAISVRKFLVKNGISADRIVIEFNGLSKPSDSNDTLEGRAKNRRVEFKILEK
jgi:outer membrane protein OmpA-like peptidoglycan-associated protein